MKKVKVENTDPKAAVMDGGCITVQMIDDSILVLNIYMNKILKARHCINVITKEYATLKGRKWSASKIETALDATYEMYCYCTSKWRETLKKKAQMSNADEKRIRELLKTDTSKYRQEQHVIELISGIETDYSREKREIVEMNRLRRVKNTMNKIPDIPERIKEWINQKELGGMDFMIKDKKTGQWTCSGCGKNSKEEEIKTEQGKTPKDNDIVICPMCGKHIQILKRKKYFFRTTHFALVQPINDSISVIRHFEAEIVCEPQKKKAIGIKEEIRIVMYKDAKEFNIENTIKKRKTCDIFYEQYQRPMWVPDGEHYEGNFDNKGNPANKRAYQCYLYDLGIEEAFKNTAYEAWTRVFAQMAAASVKANYNRLMVTQDDMNMVRMVELLFKGRFTKLLQETSDTIDYWTKAYYGPLKLSGGCMEDVFDIGDRQKINRIREKNGGEDMLFWMRWSDRHHQKISDKALKWLMCNKLDPGDMRWAGCRFSLEQAMNYIERQKKESYKGKSTRQVIAQYEDYMNMCERLHKDTSDEMIYRPRELKRRHDEAAVEIAEREAELQADEFSRRFPGVEDVLSEIKEKYEYSNDKYSIKVPEKCIDIVMEGRALHHCAGSSDRYFDRIRQRETYIVFLRKNEEPDKPYYTVEVEPGGTIRQHRGYLDEEPEIEEIKPFLRKWQKEIKKRMTDEDRRHAAVSAVKRIENIQELQEKNNTRVLNGLMEDFMEAI